MAEAGRAHGLLNTFLRLNKSYKKASMNIISDSDGHMQVTITVTIVGQADQAPMGGAGSPTTRRGALALRPPALHPLHPLHLQPLHPLHLQQQPLSLQEETGAGVSEPCYVMKEDDSGGLSPASSHT